jgi:CRISPR-associated endonuclease/helicase Cas3
MSGLQLSDFPLFFKELYGKIPFPWQTMLLEQVANKGWPDGINLPTASGKTACMDIALFLLAMDASDPHARRRIFFVVDRRIVVDAAYERASRLADALASAQSGVVAVVARKLRELSHGEPLVASRLRGGAAKDNAWRLNPAQPAVIAGTVDQVGSRLLFRSYGSSTLSSPIDAAMVCCDSLILLDEAHCAVPFSQTVHSVQRYASHSWSQDSETCGIRPLSLSILSATLPDGVGVVFPLKDQYEKAMSGKVLQDRISSPKPAQLVLASTSKPKDCTLAGPQSRDSLVLDAAKRAVNLAKEGHTRIAIMVNRVATAGEIHQQLVNTVKEGQLDADVILLTGRMRPFDRDCLVDAWFEQLRADSTAEPVRPIIVVTTQCLEVGADFSFDALLTECASLDALRQRFGRLNRLGAFTNTAAAVLIRKGDVKPDEKLNDDKPLDPVYGNAMSRTWNWLQANADENGRFDFGISTVQALLDGAGDLAKLMAPATEAPLLLPAHLDMLCQTSQPPVPEPDIGLFLHGRQSTVAEVHLVFRSDLANNDHSGGQDWVQAVSLLPPISAEALTIPLHVAKRWLAKQDVAGDVGRMADVEGTPLEEQDGDSYAPSRFLIWRSHHEVLPHARLHDIRPGDTIVIPADGDAPNMLRYAFALPAGFVLDIAEPAYLKMRQQPVLRLLRATLEADASKQTNKESEPQPPEPLRRLVEWAFGEDHCKAELLEHLKLLADSSPSNLRLQWQVKAAQELSSGGSSIQIEMHPLGGVVLIGKCSLDALLDDDFSDGLETSDAAVELPDHSRRVMEYVRRFCSGCIQDSIRESLVKAAGLHDLGKADPRFQVLLHGRETSAAIAMTNGRLLAKSQFPQRSRYELQRIRLEAGLPNRFRHEMLSVQMVQAQDALTDENRDLILHMVASHHGYARPFAPPVRDTELPAVDVVLDHTDYSISHKQRLSQVPPHHIGSGVSERFWALTRRFGWWGLSYLEAILRCADHAASACSPPEEAR